MGSSVILLPYQVIFKRPLRPSQPGFFNVWMTWVNNMFLETSHHRKIPFWAQTCLNWRGAKGRLKPGESCGKLGAKRGYLSQIGVKESKDDLGNYYIILPYMGYYSHPS